MAANPVNADFDVREDLSLTIEEFDLEMNKAGYVGHRLLPPMPKDKKAGKVPRLPLEETMQDIDVNRNPDGSFKLMTLEYSSDSYDTQSKGLESQIDDETLERYDDLTDAEASVSRLIEECILRAFEIDLVSYFTTPANYAASRTTGGLTSWLNAASAAPYANIDAEREAFFLDFGKEPNALFLARSDMRAALNADDTLGRIKNQNFQDARPGSLNANAANLAQALDIPEVIVANSLKNTGNTRNLSRIWPVGVAVMAHIAQTDDPAEVCLGRSPVWSPMGVVDGDRIGVWAESYEKPEVAGSRVRRRANWGRKIWHPEAARLILIHGQANPD